MPRTSLAVQTIVRNSGAQCAEPGADQANGNVFINDGKTRLIIRNGDASPRTATVRSVLCSHGRSGDITCGPIAAGTSAECGPFDIPLYNQSDGISVNVDWSAGTTSACKCTPVTDGS